ncbi:hypothetical protein ACTXT7_001902 [Hymenolepis weldensis]
MSVPLAVISQKLCYQTIGHSPVHRSSKNTADKELMITSTCPHVTHSQTVRALPKAKGEGATEEVIQKFQLTYRTTSHLILGGQTPAKLSMGRTVRNNNHAMVLKNKTNEPAKVIGGMFIVGDPVFARNFRIYYSRTAGTVVRRGKVIYEIQNSRTRDTLLKKDSSKARKTSDESQLEVIEEGAA